MPSASSTLFLALSVMLGCAARTPPPTAAQKSDACQQRLAGMWHHADDPSYGYHVVDQGANVVVHTFRKGDAGSGGGHAHHGGGGAAKAPIIELERTASGLVGVTRQTQQYSFPQAPSRECTVEFQTRVVACEENRLTLEMEQTGAVNPDCSRNAAAGVDVATHHWIRDSRE